MRLAFAGCIAVAFAAEARAEELRPTWECLPEGTAAIVRVPDLGGFVEAVSSRSRFGAVMVTPDRWKRIAEILIEQFGGEDESNVRDVAAKMLGAHGLSFDDLAAAFSGDCGAALLVQERPAVMMVAWIEPGAQRAERIFAGIGGLIEEGIDRLGEEKFPPVRTDLELAGRPVISVELPVVAQEKKVGVIKAFVARVEGRIVFGAAPVSIGDGMKVNVQTGIAGMRINTGIGFPRRKGGDSEQEAETDLEETRRIFERFLLRHEEGGDAAPLVDAARSAGVQDLLPAGVPLVEAFADPRIFLASMRRADEGGGAETSSQMGLDSAGTVAWRQSLDGTAWRSHLFLAVKEPKQGLMKLLDQDADQAEVPPFVSREPISYRQISLDLGLLYRIVREAVLRGEEPPPGNAFGAIESASLSALGMEVPEVLSAFGTRHWILGFPPRIEEAIAHARRVRKEGAAAVGARPPQPYPMAIVWQPKNEKPFAKLLQMAAAGNGGKVDEEQGFQIVRMGGGNAAVCLGQGHLVVALGEGVAEKVLSSIRNPPEDSAAMRTSDTVAKANELVPPGPAGFYDVTDESKTGGAIGSFFMVLQAFQDEGDLPPAFKGLPWNVFTEIRAALPSAEEIQAMLGAGTTLVQATDAGILVRIASDLPPP